MTKGMRKDFNREIRRNFSRFLSIMLIVVLGVAFFSGLRAAKPAMQATADFQYDNENFMDIRVAGTLGVTDGDIEALKKVEGVSDAEGVYEKDFLCQTADKELVTKIMSLTDKINLLKVTEGRYPESYNECIADQKFLDESGYKIGDSIKLTTGTDEKYSQYLESDVFTIVGVGTTSVYLGTDRGSASIGSGQVNGFLVVPKEAFNVRAYTQICITVENAANLQCYSKSYIELIDRVKARINDIADSRCGFRYLDYQDEIDEYIEEARFKFEEEKAAALEELGDAYQMLLDATTELETGRAELESQKLQLQDAMMIVNINVNDLETNLKKIDEAKQGVAEAKRQAAELESQLNSSEAMLVKMKAEIDAMSATSTPDEILEANVAYLSLQATVQYYKLQLSQAKAGINTAEEQVKSYEDMLINGVSSLEEAKIMIEEAPAKIEEAEKKLAEGQIELERKKEEYKLAQEDLVEELAAAEDKLKESEEEIRNVSRPTWYVLDRESIASYSGYKSDSEGMGSIGAVFPAIFFLVAALVSLTTMTRMVEEQRTQIGTLKALGYTKTAIASKYVFYALLASAVGSIAGVLLGETLIPPLVVNTYKIVYSNLRYNVMYVDITNALIASGLAILCTTVAAFAACYNVMRSDPAELMRPEAPKAGKRIWLEKVKFIWKRLNFTQKAASRNLFRYKKRLFMTIVGVAGCMALLLVGFGLNDSIKSMSGNQFNEVWHFQGTVGIDSNASRAEKRQTLSELNTMTGISEYLQTYRSILYANAGDSESNAYVIVPQDTSRMTDYVSLTSRNGKNSYAMDDSGVIITEKLAKMLGVSVGDKICFKTEESGTKTAEVAVSGIVENYIYHYIYMTPNIYKMLFNETAALNSILIKTDGTVDDATLSKTLMDTNGINAVTMNSSTSDEIGKAVRSIQFIVVILIVAAGLLAFVVLYNLNNINITERRRELATLRVLGFYDKELAAYVYRENVVLTIFGIILGIAFGVVLHAFVMRTIETDVIMFGRVMKIWSYLFSVLFTIGFSVLVNWVMYFRLKKIDMVESLKSVE